MAIRIYRPTSPGRRQHSSQDFSELTSTENKPQKSLLEKKTSSGGRNVYPAPRCLTFGDTLSPSPARAKKVTVQPR